MRFLYSFILISILAFAGAAQSPSAIKLRCSNPYGSFYGQIVITAGGDIKYSPCPTSSSVFYQVVDFSNATVVGLPFTISPLTTKGDLWGFSTVNARVPVGANGTVLSADSTVALGLSYKTIAQLNGVTGTGTTNFVPRWTNGAGGVIGNTPFSWDGTQYVWNNTALNASWQMTLTPDAGGSGAFVLGDGGTGLNVTELTNTINLIGTVSNIDSKGGVFTAGDVNNSSNQLKFTLNDGAKSIDVNSRDGVFTAGDTGGFANSTKISIDDSVQRVTLGQSNTGLFSDGVAGTTTIGDFLGAGTTVTVDDNASTIVTKATSGITENSAASTFTAGDTAGVGQSTTITLTDTTKTIALGGNGGSLFPVVAAGYALGLTNNPFSEVVIGNGATQTTHLLTNATVNRNATFPDATGIVLLDNGIFTGISSFTLLRTITTGGTTGAQTIDKPAGTVNFAGGASALTVTNSTVTANSIIQVTARTNDATCYVKNYVPAAGSFVINMVAACTAETSVGFMVTN